MATPARVLPFSARRQILPTLDLRTPEQRRGITQTQQTMRALAGILQTMGQAEKLRREGQMLDRVARAVGTLKEGSTIAEAIANITSATQQQPQFGTGIQGILQKIGGAFQPPSGGGVKQNILQAIIGQKLKQAFAPKFEEPTGTFAPGTVTQRDPTGKVGVLQEPATPKTTQTSSVITDPNDPNKAIRVRSTFDQQGNLINQEKIGEATLAEKIGGVAAEGLGLQKPTQTKIEKDIIDLDTTLTELDAIDKQFNEEFFTFVGKGAAAVTALQEKLKIPVGSAQTEFLSKKTRFFADSKRVFLKFRKFITGVAGGIEEFREIAKATIDPESDSPTQFKAKLNSMRDNALRTRNVLLAIRNSGLDPNDTAIQKQVFRGLSLRSIPIEVLPDVTLETISQETGQPSGLTPEQQRRREELRAKAGQ